MNKFGIFVAVIMDCSKIIFTVQVFVQLIFCKGGKGILQGAPVIENDYPFMVLIRKELNNSAPIDLCSGIIINKEWILTLATCIHVNFINNPLEAKIYLENNEKSLQQKHIIKKVENHPAYELQVFPINNLALLQLQTPLVFSDTIKCIDRHTEPIATNSRCSVSGWGSRTTIPLVMEESLHYDNMTVSDQADCKSMWSPYTSDNNLCTDYEEYRGLSYGDMGGALVMQGKLIGIAGFADVSGIKRPDVYWRVAAYEDWIENIIRRT